MFLIGDVHGYTLDRKYGKRGFDYLLKLVEDDLQNSNIIQVGDFGMTNDINRMNNFLNELNKLLVRVGSKMYVIRGNHDNPVFWDGTYIYSNLELVPDYETRVIEDKKILFIGGAISIDRKDRIIHGGAYWVDEKFVLDKDKLKTYEGVDIVVTHTAPRFAYPQTIGGIVLEYTKDDPTLMQELGLERAEMTMAYDVLKNNNKITNWVYGHFHTNRVTMHEDVEFRLVSILDVYHLRTEAEYGN